MSSQHGHTERLRAALLKAVEVIQMWHNMGMSGMEASKAWDIYWKYAPELKLIREALSESTSNMMDDEVNKHV